MHLREQQQQLEAQSGAELQCQVQQQLAEQQHLLQQQQADLQVKQQQVEEQLQEAADQQAISTNHPLPDHPPCSPHVPESLRSPLIRRPRQDTTLQISLVDDMWQVGQGLSNDGGQHLRKVFEHAMSSPTTSFLRRQVLAVSHRQAITVAIRCVIGRGTAPRK
ncbi:hypothetical protein HaLaN_21677, partial [Haematococcus lacustris]